MEAKPEEPKTERKSKKGTRPVAPPGFNPGAFKPVVSTQSFLEAEKPGVVLHDFTPLRDFAKHFGTVTYCDVEQSSNDPPIQEDWVEKVLKMFNVLMSKKLSSSLPPTAVLESAKIVTHMQKSEFWFPSALMPVLDTYGKIRELDSSYDLCGQIFLCLTYGMRGLHPEFNNYLGVNNVVNRETDIFINTQSPSTFAHAKVWLIGFINAWVAVAPVVEVNMGNAAVPAMVRINVPKLVSGAIGFRAFANIANPPPSVVTALQRLEFLESIPEGNVWTADQVNGAFAVGIQVVSFNRDDLESITGTYAREVQPKLIASLQIKYNMVPIKVCSDKGSMGQLIRRDKAVLGHAPEKIGNDVIDIGWMLSGGLNYASMEAERFMVTSNSTNVEMMTRYFNNMRKH